MTITRRSLLGAASAGAGLSLLGAPAIAQAGAKVVVVGGGFGGAAAARYLKKADAAIDVTLVERDDKFVTCPFSNYVIAGFRKIEDITHGYDGVRKAGVKVVKGEATAIDTTARVVTLGDGAKLPYDRLVVSPGVDLDFAALPGYTEAASERMPHAWKAGAQTLLLRRQLEAMPDGGTFILSAPANPFRCPPGPYERVSVVAWYLKNNKPKSKILVLDAKDEFSKQGLFQAAWESEFPGMITWIAGKDGGKVESVDPAGMSVKSGFGAEKGAVVNVIPPQRAGRIAQIAGLTDEKGWCPVDPSTFASRKAENVHVIGDACIAGAMPKSGSSANAHGKAAAAAIAASLARKPAQPPALFNICYSLVKPDYGISVTNVYMATADKGIVAVPNSGGVSVRATTALNERKLEADYTVGWYKAITADTWG
ncbi:MAG: FAD-dependent oxidoreductase [Rhodospirillales bacterium]|nr:FAD-dependent oxidoreductase [Rhodospirillales bacterium]QQS14674.1 MAG: FAD-dependent oxidoreductase [Rhodospirillales bacterium]